MTHMYLVKGASQPYSPAFRIDNLNNLNWSIDTPVTPMPLPEDTHEENILVKMEGNTAKMDVSWTLTEAANFGTLSQDSAGVYSFEEDINLDVYEQINKFKEDFVPISIGDAYKMIITDDVHEELMLDEGTISNMSFTVSGSSPIVWNVNCSFYVGNVVAVLEADIPPAPTNVLASSPSSAALKFIVTAYDGYATEPTGGNVIRGVAWKYKRTDKKGTWSSPISTDAQTSDPITYTITGLDKTGATTLKPATYRIKVAQYNDNNAPASQYYWKYGKTSSGATDIIIT
tara:strand:- start:437 stop:1297 length:861 start_codon:yes stop_codon:yes gene_type:complete